MAWSTKHYKNLNNVKVKQRFRRRSSVGELDTRKGATTDGIQPHCTWQYVRGWSEEKRLKVTGNKAWKIRWTTFQHALKLEWCKEGQDRLILVKVFTPCPLEFHKTSDEHYHFKPWQILPEFHIGYGNIWIYKHSCKFRWSAGGWVQSCTGCILKKAQMVKPLSPCNSLGETTPKTYMAWPYLNLGSIWQKQRFEGGLFAKLPYSNL